MFPCSSFQDRSIKNRAICLTEPKRAIRPTWDRRAIRSVWICLSRDLCVTVGLALKRACNPSNSPVKERQLVLREAGVGRQAAPPNPQFQSDPSNSVSKEIFASPSGLFLRELAICPIHLSKRGNRRRFGTKRGRGSQATRPNSQFQSRPSKSVY